MLTCLCNFTISILHSQVKMLQGLGLKSTLITDGSSPINLFNTAHGLLGALGAPSSGEDQPE